jgi:hypothetical protein
MSGDKSYKKPLLKLRQRTYSKLLCIETSLIHEIIKTDFSFKSFGYNFAGR